MNERRRKPSQEEKIDFIGAMVLSAHWKLDHLLAQQERQVRAMGAVEDALTRLETTVEPLDDAVEANNLVLTELARLVREAGNSGDPRRVLAVADAIDARRQRLTDNTLANTPAAPEVT